MADRIVMLGGSQEKGIGDLLSSLLLIGGVGLAGYVAYKYFIENAAADDDDDDVPACTEGEVRCINNYEYVCQDGKLMLTGETCLTPTCVEGSTKCASETETIFECIDGQWLDTGVSCAQEPEPTEILSVGFLFWYEGTQTPVPSMPCIFTNRETGDKWEGMTDAGGVVRFYGIPLGTYTLAMTLDGFHVDDYAKHTPYGDWKYIDLSTMSYFLGKEWVNPAAYYMLKNVPSEEFSRVMWVSDYGVVTGDTVTLNGSTTKCPCTSITQCKHSPSHILIEVRNRWNEPVDAEALVQRYTDDNVCFTEEDIPDDCSFKPLALSSIYKRTESGRLRAWVWANTNNDFRQWISTGVVWQDPVTGETEIIGWNLYFQFYDCLLSSVTCYEPSSAGVSSLDNSQCPAR